MRSIDWSLSPLGLPEDWPHSLRGAVSLMLGSKFPMFLVWGRQFITLYNDGYIPILGARHPAAFGRPLNVIWEEIWPRLSPLIEQAFGGEAVFHEDLPLTVERNGYPEQAWFTFSYSAIYDDDGEVVGMFCACTETTARVHAERRQALVLQTIDRLKGLTDAEDITVAASELLGRFLDVPHVFYAEVDDALGTFEIKRGWARSAQFDVVPVVGQCGRLDDFGPQIISTLRAGIALSVIDVQTDERTRPHADAYAMLGLRSMLVLPLLRDGRLIANLNLYDTAPRRWSDSDQQLAADIVERICGAIHQGRAESALRASEARQALLLELGETLRELSSDPSAMMAAATKALAHALDVPRVGYADVDDKMEYSTIGQYYNDLRRMPDIHGRKDRLDDFGPALVADIRAGRVMRVDDLARDPRTRGPSADAHATVGARATLAAPVQRHGRTVAFIFAHHDAPRHWSDDDAELARETADHTWAAVERARAEQALRQADRRKDEFLAMLAHELRNPLAPISSAAELLRMMRLDPERVRATSEVIVRQVDHMTGLINDLLDVSRVTRGLITLAREEVDIRHVVSEAVDQVQPLIATRRHYLTVQTAPDSAHVLGDRKRLVQVVANLLSNAAKYTPDGGEIAVRMEVDGREVALCVIDNGIGMSAELLPTIFDLFAQAERTSDRSQGGLGLGLALVKSLVQLHGGSVQAHSEGKGKGSRLTVRLPLLEQRVQKTDAPPADPASAMALPSRALRLMVVDDNVDAAQMMAMFLEAAGHRVVVEHDPANALAQAERESFDACLLDIGLPGMDGNELARRLRTLPRTARAMLIAITGYGQQFDRKASMLAGFNHYLVKPAMPNKLIELLAAIRPGQTT